MSPDAARELSLFAGPGDVACAPEVRAVLASVLDALGDLEPEQRLGLVHQWLLAEQSAHDSTTGRRTVQGAFFTSGGLSEYVAERATSSLGALGSESIRICDPSCGSGNLLLATARAVADGDPVVLERVLAEGAFGVDVDPLAVDICRFACWLASGGSPRVADAVERHVVVDDALLGEAPARFCEFDLVVGNPPFLGQLSSRTVHDRDVARALAERYGSAAAYTNPATFFLLLAASIVRENGRVVMVQPESVLAARDSRAARASIADEFALDSVWVSAGDRVFDAQVGVCVVDLRRTSESTWTLRRSRGDGFEPLPKAILARERFRAMPTWSQLVAVAYGVPEVRTKAGGRTLSEIADFTADFRDQYYGLVPYVREADDGADSSDEAVASRPDAPLRLMTVGLVDLAWDRWGEAPARFGKREFERPVVSAEVFDDPKLGAWASERSVPKVVVATQTRAIECVADESGRVLPSVPAITGVPKGVDVWHLAAAVGSPVASAVAAAAWTGTALVSGMLKPTARQLGELPAPTVADRWDEAAELFRAAQGARERGERAERLAAYGAAACAAYGLAETDSGALLDWWLPRVTRRSAR